MKEKRLKAIIRVNIYGIIGLIYSLFLLGDYIINSHKTWTLIISLSLLISSIIFIVSASSLKKKLK